MMKHNLYIILLQIIYFIYTNEAYRIGVGRADCTGPAVEIVFVSSLFILLFMR